MTAYWVSTPRYTVLMVVDEGGVIRQCAPYCRKWALGHPWADVCARLRQWQGAALRVERLTPTGAAP
jgi:hypothetical protein